VHVLADVGLFSRAGGIILSRWAHYLAGITWIGLLYYFNFIQGPAFAALEAGSRTDAIAKLVPRALWWFRWAAALTVLSGFFILGFQDDFKSGYFKSAPGISISSGILLGLIMFLNVWGVIWRNQKIVIANAQGVQAGREADPSAPSAARKALLASRTNTVFSIPLIFFMGATSHFVGGNLGFNGFSTAESSHRAIYFVILLVLAAFFELNGLGLLGGFEAAPHRWYVEKHRDTIITGFALMVVLYVVWVILF